MLAAVGNGVGVREFGVGVREFDVGVREFGLGVREFGFMLVVVVGLAH